MENVEADARTPHAEGAVAEAMAARSRLESSTRSSSESSARADDGRRGARGGIRHHDTERRRELTVATHDYQTFPPPYLSKVMASPRRATSSPVWATVDWAHVPAAVWCRASLGAGRPRRPERRSRARIHECCRTHKSMQVEFSLATLPSGRGPPPHDVEAREICSRGARHMKQPQAKLVWAQYLSSLGSILEWNSTREPSPRGLPHRPP